MAKPSSSLLVVTRRAARCTCMLALPITMLNPERANMSTSLGMSPMVATCSAGMRNVCARYWTTVPLLASGWVMSR